MSTIHTMRTMFIMYFLCIYIRPHLSTPRILSSGHSGAHAAQGFPMPTGCHFTQKLSDQPVNGGGALNGSWWWTWGEYGMNIAYMITL